MRKVEALTNSWCLFGLADAIERLGRDKVAERYGNLFEMYERITDDNPYETPMRIFPPCTIRWAVFGRLQPRVLDSWTVCHRGSELL